MTIPGALTISGNGTLSLYSSAVTADAGWSTGVLGISDSGSLSVTGDFTNANYLEADGSGFSVSGTLINQSGVDSELTAEAYAGTPTPEPATLLLMGAGLAGLGLLARRRSRRKQARAMNGY